MNTFEPDWTEITKELGPKLYRYFLGSVSAPAAADLVQETLIRLLKKVREGDFTPEKGNLQSYAFGVARFVRLEHIKKKKDFELVDDEAELDVQVVEVKDHADPVAHLRWAIQQLKPVEQDLILRMIDDECTFEVMAVELDMPLGTVKSHIHRAKEKLKQIMEVQP